MLGNASDLYSSEPHPIATLKDIKCTDIGASGNTSFARVGNRVYVWGHILQNGAIQKSLIPLCYDLSMLKFEKIKIVKVTMNRVVVYGTTFSGSEELVVLGERNPNPEPSFYPYNPLYLEKAGKAAHLSFPLCFRKNLQKDLKSLFIIEENVVMLFGTFLT